MVICKIILLNNEEILIEVQKVANGQELFDQVKAKLQFCDEADYFSLSFMVGKEKYWLNMDKRIDKQVEVTSKEPSVFYWEVKFYPPAPEALVEDLTRYHLVLQIRKDINTAELPASFQTLAILGAYTAQSELGDYDKTQHYGIDYLREYTFAPLQSDELLMRISDFHRQHKGLTPAEADLYFLENAKKMALYGVTMYEVRDMKKNPLRIGIAASGLYCYQDRIRFEGWKWPRIIKISYKKDIFFIKVRPGEYEKNEKIHGFKLPTLKLAKRLWRIAVETHQFFRLNQPMDTDSKFGTFGPRKWRMSGRTQSQLKNSVTNLHQLGTPKRDFQRSGSYLSQDTYLDDRAAYTAGTLPLPQQHREGSNMQQFSTLPGHTHLGNEKVVIGYDENGQPIYNELNVNDNTLTRGPDKKMMGPGGVGQYRSEDDLLAERGYNAETGIMTENAQTMDRRPNGGPGHHDYESYDDLQRQAVQNAMLSAPPTYPGSVGELPIPAFSAESAGCDQYGNIDPSIQLTVSDRSEKRMRERDARLKNPMITIDTTADLDDQMLLDAILAVTGLDPRLGVDKIVIKTEQEDS